MTQGHDTEGQLASALEALASEFSGVFARETVQSCLADSYAQLMPARVEQYVPLLAHRFARERLAATARSQSPHLADRPLVLFVCTRNSGRSQMAAALLAHASGGRVDVASAGTQPGAHVQERALASLQEIGVDTANLFPKPLTTEVVTGADVVVTMGCGDACPVIPGRRYLDWPVADPHGADLGAVRVIRDEIAGRVDQLLRDLDAEAQPFPD